MWFQKVITAGVNDSEKVALRTLNSKYGLPESTDFDSSKLYPTIPTKAIKSCRKGIGHLSKLPLDQQSCLVAAAYVMCKADAQTQNRHFGANINPCGILYGDAGYRGLNSFKTT